MNYSQVNNNYAIVITDEEAVSNSNTVLKDTNQRYNKTNDMIIVGTGDNEEFPKPRYYSLSR